LPSRSITETFSECDVSARATYAVTVVIWMNSKFAFVFFVC